MLIGEIAKKTCLSRDTIRFYEKKGLIAVDRTDSEWNNYKSYSAATLNRLMLIKRAKGFGFTLNEIAEILDLCEMNAATCNVMSDKIQEKLTAIDQKIKELKAMKKMIYGKMKEAEQICLPNSENDNCQIV